MTAKVHRFIFGCILLFLPLVGHSQNHQFRDLLFYSIGAGPTMNFCGNTESLNYVGFHGDLTLGVNLFQHFGGRVQLSLTNAHNNLMQPGVYLAGHVDGTFRLFSNETAHSGHFQDLTLFLGIGVVRRLQNEYAEADNGFCLVPGIQYNYPISASTLLSLELKGHVLPANFESNESISSLTTLSVGILHRFSGNHRHNGITNGYYPSERDWFIGASAGINSMQYKGIASLSDRLRQITPACELTVGKHLSQILALRIGLLGGHGGTYKDKFALGNGHLDAIVNLTNLINPIHHRSFNLSAYAGGGIIYRMDTHYPTVQLDGGIISRFWLNQHWDLLADLRYTLTLTDFSGMGGQSRISVGIASLMVGCSYNIGASSYR